MEFGTNGHVAHKAAKEAGMVAHKMYPEGKTNGEEK